MEMKAILTKNHEKLHRGVQAVFDSILADFDCMFVVEELPSPEREVLRQQVHDFVQIAKAKINGPVMMELATAIAESS